MSIDTLIHLIETYRYWILFPIACFEGPLTAFIIGMLVALGYFNIFGAYAVMVFGDIVPDTLYYLLGRYGEQKSLIKRYFGKVGVKEEDFAVIRNLWQNHGGKTMFFSKLAYGLSTPFLISAGLVGMKMRKFFEYALPITFLQYGILMALGYYFSNSFGTVSGIVEHIQYVFAAVIVVGIGYYFLARYMRGRLLKQEGEERNKK